MNVDKKTTKIALISLVIALIWAYPSIQGSQSNDATALLVTILIRTVIIFAVIRFVLWIMNKNKKKR